MCAHAQRMVGMYHNFVVVLAPTSCGTAVKHDRGANDGGGPGTVVDIENIRFFLEVFGVRFGFLSVLFSFVKRGGKMSWSHLSIRCRRPTGR